MRHLLDIADRNLIRAISDPEELQKRTPKIEPYLEAAQRDREMMKEIAALGQFDPKARMRRVASHIPAAVLGMMQQIDENFMKDKRKFYRWLDEHPEWDTRIKQEGSVTL